MNNFVDVDCGTVEFESTWATGKDIREIEIQTDDLYINHQECQSIIWENKEVQTDGHGPRRGSQAEVFQVEEGELPPAVMTFVAKVAPMIEEALIENLEQDLYEGYNPLEEDGSEDVAHRYTLSYDFSPHFISAGIRDSREHFLNCTGVGWTATGSSIVATFGRHDLTGWCDLPGVLCAWNIFKRQFVETKPDFVYEHSSCLMCVACHPDQPAIVAAGSFNGEVLVLDLASDEQILAVTSINDYFHREPIAKVSWVFDMETGEHHVASISGDGNVLFWTLQTELQYPTRGFRLERPKEGRRRNQESSKTLGGTALSFSVDGKVSSSFVLGTEGGSISRFFLRRQIRENLESMEGEVKWDKESEDILSKVAANERLNFKWKVEKHCKEHHVRTVTPQAVYDSKPDPGLLFSSKKDFSYDGHQGPVHFLDCSPFHRNLFISCGADGLAKIHSMLQAQPLLEVEPDSAYLFCASWSKTRPQVFAIGSESGVVYIYDLGQSTNVPCMELEPPSSHKGGFDRSPIYCLGFNPKQRDFFAAGDGNGRIHIWQLSWKLSNLQVGEQESLSKMFSSDESGNEDKRDS